MIEATGELFIEYERYLTRLQYYSLRQFACEITGRTGLTFLEALESERASEKDIEDTFIDALKEPVLRKVHLSRISRIDALVDWVFDTFQYDFYPGEVVMYNDDNVYRYAVVREKTTLDEMTFPDGFHRLASTRYGIDMRDKKSDSFRGRKTVDSQCLTRERGIFSKSVIKAFLRTTVRRENVNSPWLVKGHLAQKYKLEIPTKTGPKPRQLPESQPEAESKLQKDAIETMTAAVKVPIEDLNLPPNTDISRPALKTDWTVSESSVPSLLETWAFFNVFLEVLILDSFTLDDFQDALATYEPCELIDELYCCMLKIIAEEQDKKSDRGLSGLLGGPAPESSHETDVADSASAVLPWRDDLTQQSFSGGRFHDVLRGLLEALADRAHYGNRSRILLDEIQQNEGDVGNDLATAFRRLSADSKLRLMTTLIDLTWQTALVRQYIDECINHLTQLRKDRANLGKDKRTLMDEVYQLRLKMRAEFPRVPQNVNGSGNTTANNSVTHMDVGSSRIESSDSEIEQEDINNQTNGLKRPRIRRVPNAQIKRNERPESPIVETKVITNSRANCELEINRIKRQINRVDDKLAKVEEEWRESDSQRLRKLGQDRFYSNYWFLESTGMPVLGMPNCSTSHAGYATGRIFVQGTSEEDMEELKSRSELHEYDYLKRRTTELESTGTSPDSWGFYDDADQVNALLDWLNPRGIRESKLKTAIEQRGEIIAQSMENREKYMTDQNLPERSSRRVNVNKGNEALARSPLNWKNLMARRTLGVIHSESGSVSKRKRKR